VDYLQLIRPPAGVRDRKERVALVAQQLKGLARELALPVVVLAQLNREIEKRPDRRPRLSDLRASGAIEAHADVVLLMHRPVEARPELVEVDVAKQRNGPTGEVALYFRRHCMRFESYAPEPPAFGPARGVGATGPGRNGNGVN
jgi:replicative DNA helicase